MKYVMGYEIASLLFLSVIILRFFERRRFPNLPNKLFAFVLVASFFDILLDIGSSILIQYAEYASVVVIHIINTTFYALQITFPAFMMLYAMALGGLLVKELRPMAVTLLLPAAGFELLLLTNPFTKLFFYLENDVYYHGPWYMWLFMGVAFYVAVTLILLFLYRKRYSNKEFLTMLAFIVIVIVATAIQLMYPSYLLTGLAIALAVTMMYFTLQNPEEMLDPLTGTFNRAGLITMLRGCIEDKRNYGIIAVDMEDIRRINSLFGPPVGNAAIVQVAKFLSQNPKNCWPFRLVGARFVLVTSGSETFDARLQETVGRFSEPWNVMNMGIKLSATVFYIRDTEFIETPEAMLALLETAMPELKKQHRGGVCEIDKHMVAYIERQDAVDAAIRRAIDRDGFTVNYQPLYSLASRRFDAAEALVRLKDPVLGNISPAEFIPIAEKNGLIVRVDEIVIRKVCELLRQIDPSALGLKSIEVNLSAVEFLQEGLPQKMLNLVRDSGADPKSIIFEITETAASGSHDILTDLMAQMGQDGFRFALDDYGTGYSNITRVVNLPFFAVKLDRSMLISHFENENSALVFEDTVAMLKKLGLVTVVEGVETNIQSDLLHRLGVDYIQGYFYSKPITEEEFTGLLESQNEVSTV